MPWFKDANGKPVWVDDARPVGPPNPTYPLQAPKMQGDMANTQANTARTNQSVAQDAQMFPVNKRIAELDAEMKALKLEAERRAQEQAQREADAKNPFNADALKSVQDDAMQQLQTIDRIGRNYANEGILPAIGNGATWVRDNFGGLPANNIAADAGTLESGGALNKVMKMAADNGGKNPLTHMSNSDVQMLARGIGNLDQSQSPENYFANLNNYAGAAKRAYAGAVGGRVMGSELERQGANRLPPRQRATVQADAQRIHQRNMEVPGYAKIKAELDRMGIDKFPPAVRARIREEAVRQHQANMARPGYAARSAPRKPLAAKFLGFE